jgi:hypothetical protein
MNSPCTNPQPVSDGIFVMLPNGDRIQATHTALLPLPQLPLAARHAHIFPALRNRALLSIGQFCDSGFEAIFTANHVTLRRNGIDELLGTRDHRNGLWNIRLSTPPLPTTHSRDLPAPAPPRSMLSCEHANNVHEMRNQRDLVAYLHRACFSPAKSTWLKAIKAGYFATWPGLTAELVTKHLPKSIATAKGHLRQERQNLRSTTTPARPKTPITAADAEFDRTHQHSDRSRTNWVYQQAVEISGQIFSDQTGRFPVTSSKGNRYIMVVYDYDSNNILAEPLKSRNEHELVRAYTKLHTHLTSCGLRPLLQKLDNECPAGLKKFMQAQGVDYQLVPPHVHRANAAEKAISTWKDHFVAGLSSTDPAFPLHLWCRLIQHATTTLNLLRPSRINPKLSAEAQLNGAFDYNRTPLAPPGTKVLVYENPGVRRTWAPHGVDGWYLGGAPEHYRCHRIYVPKTRAERIAKTVEFFPHQCAMPKTSSADAATKAALDLVHALQHPAPAAPFATLGQSQLAAIQTLADIFSHSTALAAAPRVPSTPTPPGTTSPEPPRVLSPPAPPRTTTAAPPRVASTPLPQAQRPAPHLITPDPDDPVRHRYPLRSQANHTSEANAVVDEITGASLEYRQLIKGDQPDLWIKAFANDLGMLAQGVGTRQPTGTNTIFFIPKTKVPCGRQVTYGRIVASIRPHKQERNRVRLTVGGDRLDYPGITSTQTASLTTSKCLFNSTVSTPGAKFLCLDIKNFYYNTPMARYEYMRIPLQIIPAEIIDQYALRALAEDGWVYVEIQKGMPGLKQAGIIANKRLQTHLAKYGYAPAERTPALWTHHTRPITFALVVDDFGIKYVGKHHADHLINAVKDLYGVSLDWTGSLYCGLTLQWDYRQRTVDVSMPGYVAAALHKFQHPPPIKAQDAPHAWNKPVYGSKVQYAADEDDSDLLAPKAITWIQQIVGTLLYYATAVDPTMLVALGDLSSDQSRATAKTWDDIVWLLNYAHTHPNAEIRYVASDMWLHVHSDASYLSVSRARSRAGGHFILSTRPRDPTKAPTVAPTLNGPIHSICKIMTNVMGSAAEAEIGAAYINAQEAVPIRTTLAEMGHPQPSTPIQVDNTTAVGFANDTMKQKRSKAIDMRFYWVKCRTRQKQFIVYWGPGTSNLADYHTKHHSPAHHRQMRPTYLHPTTEQLANTLASCLLRGCVNSRTGARARECAPKLAPPRGTPLHKPRANRYVNYSNAKQRSPL